MATTPTTLACPHCHGTNLVHECMQPIKYYLSYSEDEAGKRSYIRHPRWVDGQELHYLTVDYAESRQLMCDDCFVELAVDQLVAL